MWLALEPHNVSPSGYKEIKEPYVQNLPSMWTLKKHRARATISEGCDPHVCGSIRDYCNIEHGKIIYGHFMVDETKLKNKTCTNALAGTIFGFAANNAGFFG